MRGTSAPGAARFDPLSADAEVGDQLSVPLDVSVTDIVEQAAPLTHQHEETPAAVMVLFVDLQMLGEVGDACS